MGSITTHGVGRSRLLLSTFCTVIALGLVVSADRASAGPSFGSHNFCTTVWLQPFGQAGDRCAAGHDEWGHIGSVSIETFERAGCVNYEGWYGELYRSWFCIPSNTGGSISVPRDGGSYDGIIRNNNLKYGGQFRGGYWCCWSY